MNETSYYDTSSDWQVVDDSTNTNTTQQQDQQPVPGTSPEQPQQVDQLTQLQQQSQQLGSQVEQMRQWLQQNPYAPNQQQNPEEQKVKSFFDNYLKERGVLTQNELNQHLEVKAAEGIAKTNGFANFNTAYNYYSYAVDEALATGQKTAEAQQVVGLANQGRWTDALNMAVKYFGKPQSGVPNLNISTNHAPDNSQFSRQGNYYGSPEYWSDSNSSDQGKRIRAQKAFEVALKTQLGFET